MSHDPTELDPRAVGARIRERRTELGLSQRELATPRVSYAYISRIEAGHRRPSFSALVRLARPLLVTAEWLAYGDKRPRACPFCGTNHRVRR